MDDKQNIVLQKLTALQQQVVDARFELVGKQAVYQQFLALQNENKPIDSLPAIVGNEAIQTLKTNLATLRDEHAKLTVQFGDKMPQVIASNARITQAELELQAAMQNVVTSVESDYRAAASRVQALESSLNQQKNEAMGLDRKMMAYSQLAMDAKSERQLYEKLLEQFNEGGVSGEFKGSNIQVVDPAETPQYPILPQVQRDLMMSAFGGLMLAIVLAFGFEYFDSRIKSPDEVKAYLDVPFLGMEQGVPVTCSSIPPLQEYADDAALYFDPQRTDEIADALDRMADDSALRERLREGGRRRALLFTPREMARRHHAVYRRACEMDL